MNDLTNPSVIVFWNELAQACAQSPASPFVDVAHVTLQKANDENAKAGDASNPGAFKESMTTTFDRPASVGLTLALTEVVHDQSVVLVVHASGWVERTADGSLFSGLMIAWDDGMYTHADDGQPTCVSGPQYVQVDEIFYFTHDYAAPGEYGTAAFTRACIDTNPNGPDQIVQQTADPVAVGH